MFQLHRLQDIHLEDLELRNEYYTLYLNGAIEQALKLIQDNPQLESKVINSKNFNKLINKIIQIQQYYLSNVDEVLKNKVINFQLSIDELLYMNNYDSTSSYEVNNFVLYDNNICFCIKKPPVGTAPTNNEYWITLNTRGAEGSPSLGVNYVGNWSSGIPYTPKNVVTYNNDLYVCVNQNISEIPTDTNNWLLVLHIAPKSIFVSETEPSGLQVGDVWLKLNVEIEPYYKTPHTHREMGEYTHEKLTMWKYKDFLGSASGDSEGGSDSGGNTPEKEFAKHDYKELESFTYSELQDYTFKEIQDDSEGGSD